MKIQQLPTILVFTKDDIEDAHNALSIARLFNLRLITEKEYLADMDSQVIETTAQVIDMR